MYLLSVLRPNQGFFGLDDVYLEIFRQAFHVRVTPAPTEAAPPADQLYLAQLQKWADLGAPVKSPSPEQLQTLELKAVRHLPASDKIKVNWPGLVFTGWDSGETVWKWTHYDQAFAIDWALLWHLTNDELREPDVAFNEVLSIYDRLNGQEAQRLPDYIAWLLALYERIMGAHVDVLEQRPHWVSNILQHPDMGTRERAERVTRFNRLLEFFKNELERDLKLR